MNFLILVSLKIDECRMIEYRYSKLPLLSTFSGIDRQKAEELLLFHSDSSKDEDLDIICSPPKRKRESDYDSYSEQNFDDGIVIDGGGSPPLSQDGDESSDVQMDESSSKQLGNTDLE